MESIYFQSSSETSLSYTGVAPLHLMQVLVIYPPWERCVSRALLSLCCFPNNEPNKCFKAEAVAICSSSVPISFLKQCPWLLLFLLSFFFPSLNSPRSSHTNKCELYIYLGLGEYQKCLTPYLLYLALFQAADSFWWFRIFGNRTLRIWKNIQ